MNALFIMEQWCDCNPACGTSGTREYYLQTWRSLNFGPACVVHYDGRPVQETIERCLQLADRIPLDMVFYTECGGIPSAQVHQLWPILARRGIPVVAIWHDSQGGIVRDLEGIACNVIVDTRSSLPNIRNVLGLWVPHDTTLFYDDGADRPYDVIFPSSRHTKSIASEYFAFLQSNGINAAWQGGQREDKLSWEAYSKFYRQGKICLNFPRNSPDRLPQVKARVTEALYSGCVLFEHGNDHIAKMLVEAHEYIAFSTKEDLLKRARWCLERPHELQRIANNGRKRAQRDYSPLCWWTQIFRAIGRENGITGMYD